MFKQSIAEIMKQVKEKLNKDSTEHNLILYEMNDNEK